MSHNPNNERLENSLENLISLGKAWAQYGLRAGSAALQVSSQSLKVTSEVLEALSETVGQAGPQRPESAPPSSART